MNLHSFVEIFSPLFVSFVFVFLLSSMCINQYFYQKPIMYSETLLIK
jgi:hypothetical protein